MLMCIEKVFIIANSFARQWVMYNVVCGSYVLDVTSGSVYLKILENGFNSGFGYGFF